MNSWPDGGGGGVGLEDDLFLLKNLSFQNTGISGNNNIRPIPLIVRSI